MISRYLRGFWFFAVVIVLTIVFSLCVFITFPFALLFDKQRHSIHGFAIGWAYAIKLCSPWWKFHIHGKHNLAKNNHAVVYVANHQSQMDILAIFMLNMRFRWIAKASLFNIPFLGWCMRAANYVPVIRGNRKSQEQCIQRAEQIIKSGVPMLFFPEGTRSLTGALGEFKSGAFRLAQATQVSIVPISIQGCAKLLPKHSLIPEKAIVKITVHPPIDSTQYELKELVQKTREIILSGI